MTDTESLENRISRLEAGLIKAEEKAATAATTALAAIQAVAHLQKALETEHVRQGHQLDAMKQMTGLVKALAESVLGKKA